MRNELVDSLVQIAREKGVPPERMAEIISHALVRGYEKNYPGQRPEIVVHIDPDFSSIRVFRRMTVVDDTLMDDDEILLDDARKICPTCNPGDTVDVEISEPTLGRIVVQTAKQVLVQKLRELERERIYEEFSQRCGEVLTGIIQRREYGNVIINLGKADGVLPPEEQLPEPYRTGERIKVFLKSVTKESRGPSLILSRRDTGLIRGLFELEVPEVADGTVVIKHVVREPGGRSKVAVFSRDPRVDPVGSCVGHRGSRVQAVVSELRNEKIDIIRWSPDPAEFIAAALSPAKVSEVRLLGPDPSRPKDRPTAVVIVPDSQLSQAIGTSGQNVRLAAHLTGWRIDVRPESQMLKSDANETSTNAVQSGEAPGDA